MGLHRRKRIAKMKKDETNKMGSQNQNGYTKTKQYGFPETKQNGLKNETIWICTEENGSHK